MADLRDDRAADLQRCGSGRQANPRWDPKKAASNRKAHDVSFDEATSVFGDILSLNMPDPDHSEGEQRILAIGTSAASRLIVVAYAERPPRTRIISARLATKRERQEYENE